jgi:hypothetical protein
MDLFSGLGVIWVMGVLNLGVHLYGGLVVSMLWPWAAKFCIEVFLWHDQAHDGEGWCH